MPVTALEGLLVDFAVGDSALRRGEFVQAPTERFRRTPSVQALGTVTPECDAIIEPVDDDGIVREVEQIDVMAQRGVHALIAHRQNRHGDQRAQAHCAARDRTGRDRIVLRNQESEHGHCHAQPRHRDGDASRRNGRHQQHDHDVQHRDRNIQRRESVDHEYAEPHHQGKRIDDADVAQRAAARSGFEPSIAVLGWRWCHADQRKNGTSP
ncbi:hypothetical protein FHX56_004797 [Paraburkholderia tropica]|nr:hypothetical protein [Paraburkholderia tropica]